MFQWYRSDHDAPPLKIPNLLPISRMKSKLLSRTCEATVDLQARTSSPARNLSHVLLSPSKPNSFSQGA